MGCDCRRSPVAARFTRFQSTHPSGVRLIRVDDPVFQRSISIHAPQWGATKNINTYAVNTTEFQSTHPSGVRPEHPRGRATARYFNPRTPVGCDRWPRSRFACCRYFNPRTPVGCDRTRPRCTGRSGDFNPRTPVGCDFVGWNLIKVYLVISIHAPQWGATLFNSLDFKRFRISIHAPQWGATARITSIRLFHMISIHAPQWGATRSSTITPPRSAYFNPRTPVGCDRRTRCTSVLVRIFQSTHPSGVRQSRGGVRDSWDRFQSTHPSGVRPCRGHRGELRRFISIHAPQWGATGNHAIHFRVDGISIHAPQWGATIDGVLPLIDRMISIHAPQWGATSVSSVGVCTVSVFVQ